MKTTFHQFLQRRFKKVLQCGHLRCQINKEIIWRTVLRLIPSELKCHWTVISEESFLKFWPSEIRFFYLIRIKWSIFQEDFPYIIPANFGTNAYTVPERLGAPGVSPGTENSARDLESPLEPYIAYVCEGSGQEIKMQPGTRHEVD